jgi:Ca-activated chloride channel homolog
MEQPFEATGGAMRRERFRFASLVLAVLWLAVGATDVAAAQGSDPEDPPALLLILDSSGSMQGAAGDGRTKLAAAKEALTTLVDDLPEDVNVGLRVYGHRVANTDKARGCKDTELIVPVGPLDRAGAKRQIRLFDATGFTPIGLSLREGAKDLPPEGKRTIVLVSDGIDTCAPPDPCKVARRIVARGIDLRIDTVGFQVDPAARRQLQCIARAGKGTYVDVTSASELTGRLQQLSIRALRRYEAAGLEVDGGDGPGDAPALLPGQYVDGIPVEGEEWYAVYLDDGQVLKASATFIGQGGRESGALNTLEARVYGPEGNASLDLAGTSDPKQSEIGGPPSTSFVETLPVGSDPGYPAPGWYYVRIATSARGAPGNYPLELRIGIFDESGAPAEPALPSAEEAPPEESDEGPGSPRAEEEPGLPASAAALLIPAVLGAALGLAVAERMRGRRR